MLGSSTISVRKSWGKNIGVPLRLILVPSACIFCLRTYPGCLGWAPPTKDLNVTAGLAIMSLVLIYGSQFRYHGLGGGLKKFGQPSVIITPLNVMEVGIRPLALCMRLFGNILGGFIIMELIKTVAPAVVPVPFSLYFDIFDGVLQAVVFVFLTTLFLSESLE